MLLEMPVIDVGLVAHRAVTVLSTRAAASSVDTDYKLYIYIFLRNEFFPLIEKSLKMQIFTRPGVYDSEVVNKNEAMSVQKALIYHGRCVDSSVLAFIMSQLSSVSICCVTGKLSIQDREVDER